MSKKTLFIFILIAVLIAAAGAGFAVSFYFGQTDNQAKNRLNQGLKSGLSTNSLSSPEIDTDQIKPLFLTTMIHLENNWDVDTNQTFFQTVTEELRYGMALAEKYGAILTFESGKTFAEGMINFDDNIMKEALARGHGVGAHIDSTAKIKLSAAAATAEVKDRKDLLDDLIGQENNIVCSGAIGKSDWYVAAKGAGCRVLDGIVSIAYLAMPLANRPDGWTDTVIISEKFHLPAPVGDERFYPFWINSSQDFVEDKGGDILLSSGETFSLAMFAEVGGRNGDRPNCGSAGCPLTMDDVTVFVNDLKDFAASRDVLRIAKYNVYFPANLFVPENEEILKTFFTEAQKLQDEGIIQWASQKAIYEAKLLERRQE